ncbi:methyl-accepting chemotaxis protein [Neorhodopirellula pilleata]|uniref:Methyl-accepting chemotaxis protein PctB n=1 Tax=Neorhodopirellula pilleata TaxID=2714738 RepID=A0A5C6ABQ9_9BACT|nr:methyl-accepting chemotaxis protein [Neorhodopirellula pilleata]TWT97472.1 Methyl-accepting chemotaxis protein PctB [Neorhodopirellula pilleata]
MKNTFRGQIALACLLMGSLPAIAIGLVAWSATDDLEKVTVGSYQAQATQIAEKIDRNLFERYGDVQAFGKNAIVQERSHWYENSDTNPIVQAMNEYVQIYDIYSLTLLVDLEGRLIAVNSVDQDGNPIESDRMFDQNFANATWFRDCLDGKFYASDDGRFTGTVVEHLYADEHVQKVYGNDGLSLGFTAPVLDPSGNVIAVWKNVANFSLVEEIFIASYRHLKESGLTTAELTLLDEAGNILIDYDPMERQTEAIVRDLNLIGKRNLVADGVAAASAVIRGESGVSLSELHSRKLVTQCAGYAPLKGALGFPGMKWNVLVRVDRAEALASVATLKRSLGIFLLIGFALVGIASFLYARVLVRPFDRAIESIEEISNGNFSTRMPAKGVNEVVRLATGFNRFADRMQQVIDQATVQSSSVAATATQVAESMNTMAHSTNDVSATVRSMATSIEQMSASISEVSVSASKSAEIAQHAASLTLASNEKVEELGGAASEIGRVIQVIEEIAEMTNLLALNATIEAARAGDAGKGFAVVANEVKALARQTSEATDDIRARIEAIQNATGQTVESLHQIGEVIQEVNTVAQSIASAVEEQSVVTREFGDQIKQTAASAETVAKGVSESATSGEDIRNCITQIDRLLKLESQHLAV